MLEEDRKWSAKNLAEYDNFRQFVLALEHKGICRRILAYTHFIPQSYFVCNEDGELIVDLLVRLESFDVGMREVCRKLNVVYDMKRENATVKPDVLDEECLDELKQRCFSLYEKDYKVLHYDPMDIG